MEKLYKCIVENTMKGKIQQETAIEIVTMLKQEETNVGEDIAIIGIAANFPMAEDADEFWANIEKGYDCIRKFPASREEDITNYLIHNGASHNEIKYNENAFLDRIDNFDYQFFKLSPKEASLMDPNQRLFLQVAWQAIEDAGYGGKKLVGSKTGVYLGFAHNAKDMYGRMIYEIDPSLLPISAVGNMTAITPSRISYILDLKGPSLITDTACSSSLIAIDLACQGIWNGYCEMAITGGIKINTIPLQKEYFNIGIESSDGRTRAFDDSADGSGLGEGAGAILLKPLSKALKDGDNIYAVIKGTSANQDGTSIGITAPNPVAQSEVISKAWKNAGVEPETIAYIETHGTGTKLGDPLEIKGIQGAFRRYTDKRQFCAISSVKGNLGHLCEAAGMASIIKAILALKNKKIPPAINFNKPNTAIDFKESPVYVNTRLREWDSNGSPRRCGVSGFGMSGTNCHIVLEEAPQREASASEKSDINIFVLSAKTQGVLKNLILKYIEFLENTEDIDIENLCYTASTGRGHYNHRLAIIVRDKKDLLEKIREIANLELTDMKNSEFFYGKHKVISETRATREPWDITEKQRSHSTGIAKTTMESLVSSIEKDTNSINEICDLYIVGADIDWEKLYIGLKLQIVKLPVYQFEKNRCWIDIPDSVKFLNGLSGNETHYEMKWREIPFNEEKTSFTNGTILLLGSKDVIEGDLLEKLKSESNNVIVVELGTEFSKINDEKYIIREIEEDFHKLLTNIDLKRLKQIVHMFSVNGNKEINSIEELEECQRKGVLSLFHLTKALLSCEIEDNIDLVIVSEFANEVSGNEARINPENSMISGFGKVVNKETTVVKCRHLDIDDEYSSDDLVAELKNTCTSYAVALRAGKRYAEEFGVANIENTQTENIEIKEKGVYVITGGTGGIGLQCAKYLATKNKIKLAFINRTQMPERDRWEDVINKGEDFSLCEKIQAIKEIEAKGSSVALYTGDISQSTKTSEILKDIRNKYEKINGIIHCAGVAIDEIIINKNEEVFKEVLAAKVQGTWLLDNLTKTDNLDFFVMFSSVATMFSAITQCDYVAANAYMDSYSFYRNRRSEKTLTINWTTWKETGMAASSGPTVDTIFKTLSNANGVEGFWKALNSNVKRVLVGEINYEGIGISLLEHSKVKISEDITDYISKYREKTGHKVKSTRTTNRSENTEVKLLGRKTGAYSEIEQKIAQTCKEILGFDEIDIYDNFFELGADSILLMKIYEKIDILFPSKLSIVDLFQYSNISMVAQFIAEKDNNSEGHIEKVIENKENIGNEIAIIGMSLKMPRANNADEMWDIIKNSLDISGEFPATRREDLNRFIEFKNIPLNGIQYGLGVYIEEVDKFDYNFFKISPKEAAFTDPHQKLFLQTALNAVEDAGYGGKRLLGSNTGVYLGYANTAMYLRMISEVNPSAMSSAAVGNTAAVAPGRLSYILDLKGPNMVIDTACSSSLIAVHQACVALRNGECDMAVAGGIRLNLLPVSRKGEKTGIGMESSDGRTKTFDDSSDGTGSGEGIGVIILKPLNQAIKDKDNIYAIVKGSAINQDGSCAGITAPNPLAQEEVIIKAWNNAGINPETISYMEAHGTGTQLGDTIEIKGIENAFKKFTDKKQFCAIGSIKSNMGHMSEAAGIAGIIKAIIALNKKVIPPHTLFNRPNRKIAFIESPVYVNMHERKWDTGEYPRRCGISGFGMSGTNCHLILEEAPSRITEATNNKNEINILTLSAKSKTALLNLIESYKNYSHNITADNIRSVCYTANIGRGHYNYRVAILLRDAEDFKDKIKKVSELYMEGSSEPWLYYGEIKGVKDNTEVKDNIHEDIIEKAKELSISENVELLLGGICELYVRGAEFDWQLIYDDKIYEIVSIPGYQFENKRSWFEIPKVEIVDEVMGSGVFYHGYWKEDKINIEIKKDEAPLLIFSDSKGLAETISKILKLEGRDVIVAKITKEYKQINDSLYEIGNSESEYKKLFEEIKGRQISQILHLMTLNDKAEIGSLEELEESQNRGVYSLHYIAKAIVAAGIKKNIDVLLVSDYVNEVTKKDTRINPENATLFGVGKVIKQEYSNIMCRCLDIDESANEELILKELDTQYKNYLIAYRDGSRYLEEIRDIDMGYEEPKNIEIKDDGVYIITGGTGGMGIEVSKHLASFKNVNIALINRSELPPQEEWDKELCNSVVRIKELESLGAKIEYFSADISNLEQVKKIVDNLREKYGKINGIIHAAGVAGEGFLFKKENQVFNQVLYPKVFGTWILNKVTEEDDLDFFIMFSSAASVFSEPGQGDYAAANSYLDSFAQFRSRQGKKTLTINWTTWKDTGMAVKYGVNFDGVFKALPTVRAIKAFNEVLNKDINKVLIGELNYNAENLAQLENVGIDLSYKLIAAIERSKERSAVGVKDLKNVDIIDIKLVGKGSDENYSETDEKLAKAYSSVLGFCEINIYDSFFELGGDSILLSELHIILEQLFPGKFTLMDLFEYTSIYKLSQYLNCEKEEVKSTEAEREGEEIELEINDLVNQMESGMLSIDDVLDNINKM